MEDLLLPLKLPGEGQIALPLKGEVGNTIFNTKGKIVEPPFSVCKTHTGVI